MGNRDSDALQNLAATARLNRLLFLQSVFLLITLTLTATAIAQPSAPKARLLEQLQAVANIKQTLSTTRQKIGSELLIPKLRAEGDSNLAELPALDTDGSPALSRSLSVTDTALVDITTAPLTEQARAELLDRLTQLGAADIDSIPAFNALRARVSLSQLDEIAALPGVNKVRSAERFMTQNFIRTEGDTAHAANAVRETYTVDGGGVKIGVLSDSVTQLAALQASGELPAVTVLPGQAGTSPLSEGTAILEILHDIAPGAAYGKAIITPDRWCSIFLATIRCIFIPPMILLTRCCSLAITIARSRCSGQTR